MFVSWLLCFCCCCCCCCFWGGIFQDYHCNQICITAPEKRHSDEIQLFSSVQSLSCVQLFLTPWIAACQASLSITNSCSSPKLMSIESVMPSRHLILCHPLLLLSLIPPSIRVFSNESTLCMRCPKYCSFSFSISPSNEHSKQKTPPQKKYACRKYDVRIGK